MKIFRMWEEVIEPNDEKMPVTSMDCMGEFPDPMAETMALELSKKYAGIFWVQRNRETGRHIHVREKMMMRMMGEEPEEFAEGEVEYPTFVAGFRNGKKEFPVIAKKFEEVNRG